MPTQESTSSTERSRALGLSTFAFTVCFAVWTIFAIIGIEIKKELGLNDTEFGLLVGTPILTGSLVRLFLGVWTDQYGGRIVFPLTMLASAASTVLLADGNVGLGGDPTRVLRRAADLLRRGGLCIAEFDSAPTGVITRWVRLESARTVGPWFRWATVGVDSAPRIAGDAGLKVVDMHPAGDRMLARLALR